jgi:hypothetical protein
MMRRNWFFLAAIFGFLGMPSMICAWPIPDTGQTTCYDEDGALIDCAGTGQDGEYLINPPSYTKLDANGNDLPESAPTWAMVRDDVTGLIWEVKQNKDDSADFDNPHDADNQYTWYCPDCPNNGGEDGTPEDGTDTQDFIDALNAGNGFGGFTDWRLPSRGELFSIAEFKGNDLFINSEFFPNSSVTFHWSSDTRAENPVYAWFFMPYAGVSSYIEKDYHLPVRAVRGGWNWAFNHLIIGSDDTVTDTRTGLMWRRVSDSEMTWTEALNHCENMTTDGYNDWRLPTIKELASITALDRYDPAIDTNVFSVTVVSEYWSSTSFPGDPVLAGDVDFLRGWVGGGYLKSAAENYVRAVRGGQPFLVGHLYIKNPAQASKWAPGCPMEIRWAPMVLAGDVEILLSTDGGIDFSPIATSTPNDGHYSWTVTGLPSVNCVLKIVPLNQPDKETSVGMFSIVDPNGDLPQIDSIAPDGPNPTNSSSLSFTVTFSETVFGVSEEHFDLETTGEISGAAISDVSGIGDAYTIHVDGISGQGTVRVNFIADCLVKDNDAFPVANDLSSPAVTIDQTAPQVQSIDLSGPAQTSAGQVQFLVDFGESLQGVDAADFRLARTDSLTGGGVLDVQYSSGRYVVTVSGYSGLGTLGLELIDDDSITDNAGNPLGGPGPGNGDYAGGEVYEIALEPEIRVSPAALILAEPNGSATFTLSLSRRPAAPVSIPLFSANRNEFVFTHMNGVSIAEDPTVVLDAGNWFDGVTVTTAARDDYRPDGDQETHVETAPATSADPDFHLMDPPNVAVTVLDNYEGILIADMAPTVGAVGDSLPVTVNGVGFGPNPTVVLFQDFFQIYSVPNPSVNFDQTQIAITLPDVESEGLYDLMVCNGSECAGLTGAITFYNAEAAEAMKRKKAVIVAGSGPYAENDLWDATRNNAELAHAALVAQGYAPENIQFLSAGPVTGNVDETATWESLEHALLYWAKGLDNPNRTNDVPPEIPADELIVYMIGHGDDEVFQINGTTSPVQRVTAGELAAWFRRLQYVSPPTMPGKLIFVYDACLAGSFLPPLANPGAKERYVVASVPNQTRAWFMDEGEFSFSGYFWNKVRSTGRLYRSFVSARDLMFLGQDQQAQIDIDGDGLPDSIDLDAIGEDVIIGRGRIAASDPPEIGRVMADVELNCERSLDIWVSDLYAKNGIDEVWAMVESPADVSADPRNPGIFRERITLLEEEQDGEYESRYSNCVRNGTYRFIFYLKDRKGVAISAPRQTVVHRNCDASLADVVWILKTLVGIPQPAPDADDFQRMDRDENGRLGLPDAVETLQLTGEL